MKNYKYILCASALLLLGASCTDGNDWTVDDSYNRLFAPTSLSLTRGDVYVDVEFGKIAGADFYQIEVSQDSLYQEEPSGSSTLIEVKDSPYTVTGLAGETKYFLRLRACSENGSANSRWLYPSDYSFVTKAEQIMNAVLPGDRDEDRITFTWTPGAEVTHFIINGGSFKDEKITISAEEKAAGSKTITGLAPSTNYSVILYNSDARRGNASASTTAAMPAATIKYIMPAGETVVSQALLDDLATKALASAEDSENFSITIGLQAGVTYNIVGKSDDGTADASVKFANGMAVTFFGLAGDTKAAVKLSKAINLAGTHAYVRFENLEMTDGGCQYFINQSEACTIGDITFKDCEIHDLERSIVRTQGSNAQSYDLIAMDNCVCTNISSGNGYSAILIGDAKHAAAKLEITNSTIDTAQRSFIENSKADMADGIFINNCTFYNVVQDGRYLIDANGRKTNITISNTILGKTYKETARGARTKGSINVEVNNFRTSDCIFSANDIPGLAASETASSALFADPDKHDFTLNVSFETPCGDPRWIKTDD